MGDNTMKKYAITERNSEKLTQIDVLKMWQDGEVGSTESRSISTDGLNLFVGNLRIGSKNIGSSYPTGSQLYVADFNDKTSHLAPSYAKVLGRLSLAVEPVIRLALENTTAFLETMELWIEDLNPVAWCEMRQAHIPTDVHQIPPWMCDTDTGRAYEVEGHRQDFSTTLRGAQWIAYPYKPLKSTEQTCLNVVKDCFLGECLCSDHF